jgi:hypothetical protein
MLPESGGTSTSSAPNTALLVDRGERSKGLGAEEVEGVWLPDGCAEVPHPIGSADSLPALLMKLLLLLLPVLPLLVDLPSDCTTECGSRFNGWKDSLSTEVADVLLARLWFWAGPAAGIPDNGNGAKALAPE